MSLFAQLMGEGVLTTSVAMPGASALQVLADADTIVTKRSASLNPEASKDSFGYIQCEGFC